jgi:hypothetical protein
LLSPVLLSREAFSDLTPGSEGIGNSGASPTGSGARAFSFDFSKAEVIAMTIKTMPTANESATIREAPCC